jgi:hypothetical protein
MLELDHERSSVVHGLDRGCGRPALLRPELAGQRKREAEAACANGALEEEFYETLRDDMEKRE